MCTAIDRHRGKKSNSSLSTSTATKTINQNTTTNNHTQYLLAAFRRLDHVYPKVTVKLPNKIDEENGKL